MIQSANERALAGGVTTDDVFALVERLRRVTDIPLVFMTYANVVYAYGNKAASAKEMRRCWMDYDGKHSAEREVDTKINQKVERIKSIDADTPEEVKIAASGGTSAFLSRMAETGMDGLILPDVPFEEKGDFAEMAEANGIDFISLIAPTSHERIRDIAALAQGFVYCVSSLGVTGMRQSITTDIGAMVRLVKGAKDIPAAVGFGISNPEQARKMAQQSDGVIVGSAIVRMIAEYGRDAVEPVRAFVKEMKAAIS